MGKIKAQLGARVVKIDLLWKWEKYLIFLGGGGGYIIFGPIKKKTPEFFTNII